MEPGWLLKDCNRAASTVAADRLRRAKEKMDAAMEAYDAATAEWFEAIAECDRLEAND